MAITSGYFNSVNGDRKYNADQMSEYFEGIINEGVCQHIDGGLAVTAGTGLSVNVAAGKAFIGKKWIRNDASLTLTISAASASYARIDAVVLRRNNTTRTCQIVVKSGTPAASPAAPTMTRNSTTYEMALAYVNVAANATSVTVTDKRADTTVCGWAAVAQATSGEVDQMLNDMKTGFDGVPYDTPGEAVRSCDEKLYVDIQTANTTNYYNIRLYWEQGGINKQTGALVDNDNYSRSDRMFTTADYDRIVNTTTYNAYIVYYDASGVFTNAAAVSPNNYHVLNVNNGVRFKLELQSVIVDTEGVYAQHYNYYHVLHNNIGNGFNAESGAYAGDLNDAPIGSVKYMYSATNAPDSTVNGWIITFLRNNTSKTQFAITDAHNLYVRTLSTTWTGWEKISKDSYIFDQIYKIVGDVSIGRNLYSKYFDSEKTIISSNGAVTANDDYNTSDYIAVDPSNDYFLTNKYIQTTTGGFINVAYYTSNYNFISRETLTANSQSVTTPSNCHYVRLMYQNAYDSTEFMFVKGEYPSKFIPYYRRYNGLRITHEAGNINEFVAEKTKNDIVVPYFPIFRLAEPISMSQGMLTLTTNDIYAMYDNLKSEYPDYITKTSLGTASDGQTIYRYDFIPKSIHLSAANENWQKAILYSGTHGEPMGICCLFYALKTMCDQWKENEQLGIVKMNTHFIVIPVVNPYGVDHMTETVSGVNLGRVNANHVNINRNFPYKWSLTQEGSDYSGPYPLSEPESQIMEDIFKNNSDADWSTSFHNYGASGYAIWHMDEMEYMHKLSIEHLKRMTASYYKSGETPLNGDYFGYCTLAESYGNEAGEALTYGIRSGTLEVGAYGNDPTSQQAYGSHGLTMGTEMHINWILMQYFATNSPASNW